MRKARTLQELFSFPGFVAKNQLEGKFGAPKVRIIELERKKKQQAVLHADLIPELIMIERFVPYVIVIQKDIKFIFVMRDAGYAVKNVSVFTWRL